MEFNLKEIAERIKVLREANGYSAEELARLTGVTAEEYARLESGESDFSFTFIYKCAHACNVEVVDILEGTSTTLSSFAVTRKGEGLKIVKKNGFVQVPLPSRGAGRTNPAQLAQRSGVRCHRKGFSQGPGRQPR